MITDAIIDEGLRFDEKYRKALGRGMSRTYCHDYENFENHCALHYADALREIQRLRDRGDMLADFCYHAYACDHVPCTCGRDAALARWREATAKNTTLKGPIQ